MDVTEQDWASAVELAALWGSLSLKGQFVI